MAKAVVVTGALVCPGRRLPFESRRTITIDTTGTIGAPVVTTGTDMTPCTSYVYGTGSGRRNSRSSARNWEQPLVGVRLGRGPAPLADHRRDFAGHTPMVRWTPDPDTWINVPPIVP